MFKLLKRGHCYLPEDAGIKDILIVGEKIFKIDEDIPGEGLWDLEVYDCQGKIICPGFIDQHLHITGGGGEEGPKSRVPEIMLSEIIKAGVTTVVGVLGVDCVTRNMAGLLAKARALHQEGITAFIYTGGYGTPLVTLTGHVVSDLTLIPEIIGAGEIAISDHRSSHSSLQELKELASEVRIGGLLGGKAGILHFHLGESHDGLDPLLNLIKESDFPRDMFVPTHLNRSRCLFQQAVRYAEEGGNIDLTAGEDSPGAFPVPEALAFLVDNGVDMEHVTVSSDGNGSIPLPDHKGYGVGEIGRLFHDFRISVRKRGLDMETVLRTFTANPARILHLYPRKGCLKEGSDADILVLRQRDLEMDMLMARGELFMQQGDLVRKGYYEK